MRKIFFLLLITLSLSSLSIQAQRNYRLQDLANRLQRDAETLAYNAYRDFTNSSFNTKSDVEKLMAAQQISASANILQRMVQDRRSNSELRDAASSLTDLIRRAPYSYQFYDIRRDVDDLSLELGNSSGGWGSGNNTYEKPVIGRVRWRGTVDDEVQLTISGNSVVVKTISGTAYNNATYNFTSALPDKKVDVEVDKKKGRGSVKVLQQPRKENNFTTVIQIRDKDGGAKDYDLDIIWR